jgi:hypothetical protein
MAATIYYAMAWIKGSKGETASRGRQAGCLWSGRQVPFFLACHFLIGPLCAGPTTYDACFFLPNPHP